MKQSRLFQIESSDNIINDFVINSHSIKTLPELIISEIVKSNSPLSKNDLMEKIAIMNYDKLRKPDGSRYGKNLKKVLISTLHSTNLFIKTEEDTYALNQAEVIKYLQRNKDKERQTIKNDSNDDKNNENKDKSSNVLNTSLLQRKRIRKTLLPSNAKFFHAYQILDDLLSKYSSDRTISKKINNPFAKCNNSVEFILKTGDSERLLGMVSCFKMFKPLCKLVISLNIYSEENIYSQETVV